MVDPHYLPEGLKRRLSDRGVWAADARVVDERIDPAKLIGRPRDSGLACRLLGHVRDDPDGAGTSWWQRGSNSLSGHHHLWPDVYERHARSVRCEPGGDRCAEPAGRAGNDCPHTRLAICAVVVTQTSA